MNLSRFGSELEIKFADGSKTIESFSKDKSGSSDKYIIYSAMVFSERMTGAFKEKQPKSVSEIALTKSGQRCSNYVRVTKPEADSTIWKDAIGANVNDDFELWGFVVPPERKEKNSG